MNNITMHVSRHITIVFCFLNGGCLVHIQSHPNIKVHFSFVAVMNCHNRRFHFSYVAVAKNIDVQFGAHVSYAKARLLL